jgi:hypothetical protein
MRHRSLSTALILIAVTGVLDGCQSVRFTDSSGASGGSALRVDAGETPDSGTTGREEAGSTFRFRPPLPSNSQEGLRPAMEVTSAAEQESALRFADRFRALE